jgi:YidC/Oxa1 family membrane protein insertase
MGSEQKNALYAVVLSGLILFGWQYWFAAPKRAAPIEPAQVAQTTTAVSDSPIAPKDGPIEPVAGIVENFSISRNDVSVDFTNSLAIKDFVNPQAAFKFQDTVGHKKPFTVQFDFGNGFQSMNFASTGEANKFYNAEHDVTVVTGMSEKGVASFLISSTKEFKYKFTYATESKKLENSQERFFEIFTDTLNKFSITDEESGDRSIGWAGIDFNYHLFATYFDKEAPLLYKNNLDQTFSMFSNKAEKTLQYNVVFVKKEYNDLTALGHNLNKSVDFGIWGFFAVWILKGLQFFYKFIPNYGYSIILLTLLIRLITFPLQYKSFVSMKKLQIIQPELTKIREKHKEDPQRLQKESMELFKRSGANPVGGCLPLLLQMPVFFAFYKVLYQAVELVDAPFILWITDLSNKDQYFVLPVLMTGAMFLQQKLTPNTISDPVQKKVMMFMPLIFGFIMKDLPSGLSLYIFVSTLFGILSQMIVFNAKSKKTDTVVVA